jgi:hypothetical protein
MRGATIKRCSWELGFRLKSLSVKEESCSVKARPARLNASPTKDKGLPHTGESNFNKS